MIHRIYLEEILEDKDLPLTQKSYWKDSFEKSIDHLEINGIKILWAHSKLICLTDSYSFVDSLFRDIDLESQLQIEKFKKVNFTIKDLEMLMNDYFKDKGAV